MEYARRYHAAQRRDFAKKGIALPDGSWPIADAQDLKDAIGLFQSGHGKDRAAAKAHIMKRAKALGLTKQVPSGMTANSNSQVSIPKNVSMSTKELHDRWLKSQPEGAQHVPEDCILCQIVESVGTGTTGDSMSDNPYSEADLQAAVAAAVKPFEARLAELDSAAGLEALVAKIAEIRAELEVQVNDLQTKLDVADAALASSKQENEDLVAYLTAEGAREAEEATRDARKVERVDQVKEAANYTDEQLEAKADRWAAMDDEEFAAFLDDLKTAGVKKDESGSVIPANTKLTVSRELASQDGSSLSSLLELRAAGIDARRL